jgi:hypothetical protein
LSNSQFIRPETIERRAGELLAKYETMAGTALASPIPIERIAEDLIDLQILWQTLPESENETILAGLSPRKKLVVFNENRLPLFDKTPGLYRTVLAHEIGHWELHVDKASVNQQPMPGMVEQLQFLFRSEKQSWDERNAHLFMSHLLMPEALLNPLIRNVRDFDWPFLYRLRDMLQVTISVLRIRLERKGLLYVDPDGEIHRSRGEYNGQVRMI